MKALHIDLKLVTENFVKLHYFVDNPNKHEPRSLLLSEIADLIKLAERDYYVSAFPEDYTVTGRRLYNWLDGSDRHLQPLLDNYRREGIVLAISATEKLAHLPWEVLHDGVGFLVQRGVVPVRWVADTTVKKLTIDGEPENRALQVLFMATSPLDVSPVLDFEGEEARILAATARQPLALTVEESGCLSELGYLVDTYGKDYFDVLHLTGHATLQDGQPRFITETPTGEAEYVSAEDIAQELQLRLPKLIFLSGCHTGQAGKAGSVPSMAEELLKAGAKAVLGWGKSVLESDATEAAATLYGELSAGKQITEAVASTYQTLIKNKAQDWHLLRLYAAGELPSALVTPKGKPGRKPAPPLSVATKFLDPAGKVKVPTRESFVGRRRQLQNCLRVLTQSSDEIGVLIHGMGGLGKSSLAARLCDRLPSFERVVLVGRIDEGSLVSRLSEKLDGDKQRKSLQNYDEELKFRLRRVFQQLHDSGAKPFLLVLDDFEVNLEPRSDSYVLQPVAAEVLKALIWAIRENYTSHRIIITCRYDFEFSQLQYFYKQPLDALHGADLQKKFSRLTAFSDKSQVDEALKSQAQNLADGNPRLLEWLDKILQNTTVDQAAILNRLAADPVELRSQVLAEALLQQMDKTMREILSRGLLFELPVPREAFAAVCENIANLDDYINRAVALGLLEVSHDEALRVPRILPVQLPEQEEALYKQAAEELYYIWGTEAETVTEEQTLEVHRLALRGKVKEIALELAIILARIWRNQSLFREAVQLCKSTLELAENYLVLNELAYSEHQLGAVSKAQEHYQQALNSCPVEDEEGKAGIINNWAILKANIGEIDEAIALYQQSLAISERIGDVQTTARILVNLGDTKLYRGEIDEAIALCEQSLAISEKIGDVHLTARTLNLLGLLKFADRGEIDEAIALYQQSLAISEEIGDVQSHAATLNSLAHIKADRGEIEQAIALYQQSLAITERTGDVLIQVMTLNSLAKLKADSKQTEQAIALYQQSFVISEHIANVPIQATILDSLADIKAKSGQTEQAITLYEQSILLYKQIGNVKGQAIALRFLADIKAKSGQTEQAIALYEQSIVLEEQIGNVKGQAIALEFLAMLKADSGQTEQAIALYEQSILLYKQIGDGKNQAMALELLAMLKADSGQTEQAIALYEESISLYKQIGDDKNQAMTLRLLADIKAKSGQTQQAITLYEQSIVLCEQISNVETKAAALYQLGMLKANQGEINEAIAAYQQSLALKEQICDVSGKAAILHELGSIKANQGKFDEAITLFQQSLALKEQIGDVQDKAMTLWWLGHIAEQQGNYNQALDYLQPAWEILQRIQSPHAEGIRQTLERVRNLIRNP